MATPKEIEQALGQALAAVSGLDRVIYPNQGGDPARPFVFFQHIPVERIDNTTEGSGEVARGYFTATVVTEAGKFNNEAQDLAWAIMQAFPFGLTLSAGSGTLTITKPPETAQGFNDGPDWRLPVRVDYMEESG